MGKKVGRDLELSAPVNKCNIGKNSADAMVNLEFVEELI
jgi:hypothetical protein